MIFSAHLQNIKNYISLGNIIWEYQQIKVGKRSAERWQKMDQKVGKLLAQKRWPNVTQRFDQRHPKRWLKVGPTSPQRWSDINDIGLTDKSTLDRRCSDNIAPTFLQWLGRRWPDLLCWVVATNLVQVFQV